MTGLARAIPGALALAVLPTIATAGLVVCNDAAARVSVAVGYKDGDWTSEGWWGLDPGACKTVIGGDLRQRFYYYRVSGEGTDFAAEGYHFCTASEPFTIVGDTDCDARGYRRDSFAELDVGEEVAWTLRLQPAPAAGGGLLSVGGTAGAGTWGEPFTVWGHLDDCALEGDYGQCSFAAEGWRWIVADDGRTPRAILDAMAALPPGTPVAIAGDILSYGDITVEAVARGLEQLAPDRLDRMLLAMQGRWRSVDDALSTFEVRGTTRYSWYDGAWTGEELLSVRDTCDDSPVGGSAYLIATELETQESLCYAIDSVTDGALDLMFLPGGNFLGYRRID